MTTVHVVFAGIDSEGGSVVGVAADAETGRKMAEAHAECVLDWIDFDHHPFARKGGYGFDYYEVTPYEVQP